jgi:hypothetical protein
VIISSILNWTLLSLFCLEMEVTGVVDMIFVKTNTWFEKTAEQM